MARLWRSPFGSGHARVFAADAWYAGDSSSRLVGHLGQPPSRSTHHRSLFCRHRTHRYWSGSGGPNWPSPTISWIDGEALTITTRLSRFEGCYLVLPAFSGCSSLIYSAYGLSWIGILFSFSLSELLRGIFLALQFWLPNPCLDSIELVRFVLVALLIVSILQERL